jgi:hypothetical protein
MTIHRLKQLVTYQRLVGQESSYYVLLEGYDYRLTQLVTYQTLVDQESEHNMMIPDQQVFDK